MCVLYACYFPLPFPHEFDPWQGGLGNLKLALVGWSGWGPMRQVRNLNRGVKSLQRNMRGCSRYGEETSPYLKTSQPGKFENPHPTKARFKFCTSRRPFVSNSLPPGCLRQSNTCGLPGGGGGGYGGGGVDEASNRWVYYCARSNDLKRSNVWQVL